MTLSRMPRLQWIRNRFGKAGCSSHSLRPSFSNPAKSGWEEGPIRWAAFAFLPVILACGPLPAQVEADDPVSYVLEHDPGLPKGAEPEVNCMRDGVISVCCI